MKPKIEPKEYFENIDWAYEHHLELQRKYKEQWVAIYNKKVVSHGTDLGKVRKEAIEKTNKKDEEIPCIFVDGGRIY
ncbi:MAG: DUF5678 domain-containing protein [Methanosarcinales archaeon]